MPLDINSWVLISLIGMITGFNTACPEMFKMNNRLKIGLICHRFDDRYDAY